MDLEAILNSIGNDNDRSQIIKAPFGYLGSKKDQLSKILPELPMKPRYVEGFGGSGIVLLNREPAKNEVFNDAHSGITAFFRCCQSNSSLQELCGRVRYMLRSREEFIWCRDSWENCDNIIERAARWYYTIQNSYNKKCKVFRRSTGNVGTDAALDSYLPLFYPVHERLKKVYIENLDWRTCLSDFDSEDTTFYLDPPYYCQENPYHVSFTKKDHAELLSRIESLSGFVALSGYPSELYSSYPWDRVEAWPHNKKSKGYSFLDNNRINEFLNNVAPTTECLFIRNSR